MHVLPGAPKVAPKVKTRESIATYSSRVRAEEAARAAVVKRTARLYRRRCWIEANTGNAVLAFTPSSSHHVHRCDVRSRKGAHGRRLVRQTHPSSRPRSHPSLINISGCCMAQGTGHGGGETSVG
jgi:hypothetical protein